MRARDHGIVLGRLRPGPLDAITDVAGVRVGHTTLIRGEGPRVVGQGPVRTGVTVVVPHDGDPFLEPVFAGCHRLNGNGELTGLEWVRESGLLTSPIAITNTHSVGVVRDALLVHAVRSHRPNVEFWSLPVVGETSDGLLNDMNGFHVRPEHLDGALLGATAGPVAEGSVGGGTGMICHEFKGGIGTASRVVPAEAGGFTVGALVQANYGARDLLRIDGVPVGEEIPTSEVPSPWDEAEALAGIAGRSGAPEPGAGSIIVVLATDAPLLPHQCARLAQRAGLGIARVGGIASNGSGDIFIAFATGNRGLPGVEADRSRPPTVDVRMLDDARITPLFQAAVEAVEAAIVNALLTAGTMTGADGITAHGLDGERLVEVMARFGRGPRTRAAGR
ncbi:MAG: P1 family peptidase [Chloroflexi bacterium]|nr:P1 family peptidase [Chloroflexota bacterium]